MINPFDGDMKTVLRRFTDAMRDMANALPDLINSLNNLRLALVDLADQLRANTDALDKPEPELIYQRDPAAEARLAEAMQRMNLNPPKDLGK